MTGPRSLAGAGLELLGIELLEEHARRLAALLSLARGRRRRRLMLAKSWA